MVFEYKNKIVEQLGPDEEHNYSYKCDDQLFLSMHELEIYVDPVFRDKMIRLSKKKKSKGKK